MSHTIIMQDWVRIGAANAVVQLQPEAQYVELAGVQDLVSYIEVAEVANLNFLLQTAAVKEEAYFTAIVTRNLTVAGINTDVVRWSSAAVPPARWFRWRATSTGAGAWSAVVRVTLNINPARV